MIRVAVAGVRGRLGSVAARACAEHAGFEFVGGLARGDDPAALFERRPDVLVDCTTWPFSVELSTAAAAHGIRPVVGTSGWTDEERQTLAREVEAQGIGALIVPNFSLGAVLMMHLAERAAKFFPSVEIVEMHRVEKLDRPSGTALETARRLVRGGAKEPQIHSVRLPGMVAHQEVLFGGRGETLAVRHDSFSHESFAPGIVAAVDLVMRLRGLTVGLDALLDA